MDTDSFLVHIKTENIYEDIAKDLKTKPDAKNFKGKIPLPRRTTKKWSN